VRNWAEQRQVTTSTARRYVMKTRSLKSTKLLSLISLAASVSLNLTTILALTALVVSVLALNAALNSSTHVLRPVVSADEIQPEVVEKKTPVEWQVFQDSEYGLRFQYPAAWSIQEAEIADSDDAPIERVLLFAPQNWEGVVTPVAVEIGVGSPEELERVWPGLVAGESSTVTAVGYRVLVWQSPSDEVLYVFEHPGASRLRVAFRDSVGEEETVTKMVDTFEFTLIHPLVPELPGVQ
jgi:hypothetical protein